MRLNNFRWLTGIAIFVAPLLLILPGCTKDDSPLQPQANIQLDYRFTDVLSYDGLAVTELTELTSIGSSQMNRLRGPISDLSAALVRDFWSDEVESSFGIERYRVHMDRISALLDVGQREALNRVVTYHVDLVCFGKDLRRFLRRLARFLELTPEQVEQLRGFARTYAEGMREVYRGVKAGTLTREEGRAQIRQLHRDFMSSFKDILTPEQIEKLRRFLEDRRNR